MPRGDRTGPKGVGPMTGRSAGFCAGNDRPGFMMPASGRAFYGLSFSRGMGSGYGRGFFRGRGYGRSYMTGYPGSYAPYPTQYQAENEKDFLENELNILKENIKHIETRLSEIKAAGK